MLLVATFYYQWPTCELTQSSLFGFLSEGYSILYWTVLGMQNRLWTLEIYEKPSGSESTTLHNNGQAWRNRKYLGGSGDVFPDDKAEQVGGHPGRGAEGEECPASVCLLGGQEVGRQVGAGGGVGGGGGGGSHVREHAQVGRHKDRQLKCCL